MSNSTHFYADDSKLHISYQPGLMEFAFEQINYDL